LCWDVGEGCSAVDGPFCTEVACAVPSVEAVAEITLGVMISVVAESIAAVAESIAAVAVATSRSMCRRGGKR
jgi:hypothetical protein